MFQVSATGLLGALTVLLLVLYGEATSPTRFLHTVCYDVDGAIDISNKRNYPVVSHNFSNPTQNIRLQGSNASTKLERGAFWKIKFKMPAVIRGIVITPNDPVHLSGIRVRLRLSNNDTITKTINDDGISYIILNYANVSVLAIDKVENGTLSFADIKINGTQAPEGTDCATNVKSFPSSCYSFSNRNGYEVDYSCQQGFRVESTRTTWSCSEDPGNSVTCHKRQRKCPAPPTVSNTHNSVERREYDENESVRYDCDWRYYLDGPRELTCTSSGVWSPRKRPRCLRDVRCPPPAVLLNGRTTGFNYRVNNNVTFDCDIGYELVGPKTIQCKSNQQWHPNAAVICKAINCSTVSSDSVANGRVKLRELDQSGFTYNNYLQIICDDGYKIVGNEIITCGVNGSWDSSLPICTAIHNSGPCSLRSNACPAGKACVVTPYNTTKCVCAASLDHGCSTQIRPMCTSNNVTLWSDCHLKNYTCLNPDEKFTILRYSPCDDGGIIKVTVATANGIASRDIYKCSLRQKVGPCRAMMKRYYFSQDENRCHSYYWGGCDPNENNFGMLAQCEKDCKEFQMCNRNEKHNSSLGINLARDRPTYPSNILSSSFVDGSRIYNETTEQELSTWNVSLLRQATISKILVWNSDYSLPWLNITLYDDGVAVLNTIIEQKGLCRYEWTPSSSTKADFVSLETSALSGLHVDEVEVIGKYNRGQKINFTDIGATAEQRPGTERYENLTASAENAINGVFEQHSGGGDGFLSCSSTLLRRPSERHWLQVDLQRAYFITEIELFLRVSSSRRGWQEGLTVYLTNTSLSFDSNSSTLLNLSNRCGEPYTTPENQTPVFPCYLPYPARYVVLTLFPSNRAAGLQVCEIEVFAVACNDPTAIDQVKADSPIDNFAPSTTSYSCKSGYHPGSSRQIMCGKNGRFLTQNGKEPFCKQI